MPDTSLPLVCICIPTYNAERTIQETLTSIVNQTYHNLKIQIVDNASTDRTLAIVEGFGDARISVHRHDINIGGEGNFNRCIQLGSGKYTAIYHADDLYESDMVQQQVRFLEEHIEVGAVFTAASLINESGKMMGEIQVPSEVASADQLYDFKTIFKAVLQYSNFFVCPSVMAHTTLYQQENISWRGDLFGTSADLDVWFRMMRHHPIGILSERLIRYRISDGQGSMALRSRTTRSDLFRVTDYYLAQEDVKVMLSPIDWCNYGRLERTDRIVRASNLYLQGEAQASKELCRDIFSVDALLAARQGRRGLVTLMVGVFLQFFIFSHLALIGQPLLRRLKSYAGK